MIHANQFQALLKALLVGVLLITPWLPAQAAESEYTATVEALQERYLDEIEAHASYGAFSTKALEDGYPNSAYLFKALAASEAIHARNFRRILQELGAPIPPDEPEPRKVGSTRANIMNATAVEANEIDHKYPQILASIKPDNHQEAIDNLTWAWKSEKQHRKLLGRMQDAAKRWFKFLIARIEGEELDYHICQICGSTLTELPAKQCPICGHPASHYRKVHYVDADRPVTEEE